MNPIFTILAFSSLVASSYELSPGLSASLDYSDFDTMKTPMTRQLLTAINNLTLPDLAFQGGFLNQNKLYVDQKGEDLVFQPLVSENAILFEIKNITVQFRSNAFSYWLLTVPIEGYMDAFMSGTQFMIKMAFINKQVNGKTLPQLNVTDCQFTLNPQKMKFSLGGNILLQLADIVVPLLQTYLADYVENIVYNAIMNDLPNAFNAYVVNQKGYLNLGDMAPDTFGGTPLQDISLDISLEDSITVTSERIEVGINGTFFNRKQGYYVSPTIKAPQNMPTYDPTLNSRLQVFVSNYFLETMLSTYFKTDPFHYDLLASEYADVTLAPFDSNTLEGIFPYLTSRFGKKVPTDISFQITDAWGVQSFQANKSDPNNQTGLLTAHARMQATVTLRYPTGDSVTVGTARFPDVEVAAYVNQTNQTLLSTWLHTCNASEMYLDTTYMGSYRSSPYVVNQATRLLINFFNRKYLSQMFLDLKSLTMGMFLVDDPYVGYYDGFMGFGMTADFANTTVLTSASPLPDRDHLDITSKIYALLRSFI